MSNNLGRTEVSASQNQKEVTINASDGVLDAALTAVVALTVGSSNAITLTAANLRAGAVIKLSEASPPPTAQIAVTCTDITRGPFLLFNNTAQTCVVQVSGQTSPAVTIPAGETVILTLQSSQVRPVGAAASNGALATPTQRSRFYWADELKPTAAGGCAALATVATAANQPDITSLDFDSVTAEHAQLNHMFEQAAHLGNVSFQFIWSHAAAATFNVAWNAKGVVVANDGAMGVGFGTAVQVLDVGGTTNDLYISEQSGYVQVASPAEAMAIYDFFRDPSADDLNVDARLIGVRMFWWEDNPLDSQWANVLCLVGADGLDTDTTVDDEGPSAHAATYVGNAQCDNAQAKFGLRSLRVDGTGDYVTFATEADFDLGSSNFCLEGWFMWNTDPAAFQLLAGKQDSTGNQRSYSLNYDSVSSNVLTLQLSTTGSDGIVKLSFAFVPTLLQWYHIAVDWDGTTYRMFLDGKLVATATGSVALFNSTAPFSIGAQGTGNFPFDGWADEVRMTKASRYTKEFTPPAAPFPRG